MTALFLGLLFCLCHVSLQLQSKDELLNALTQGSDWEKQKIQIEKPNGTVAVTVNLLIRDIPYVDSEKYEAKLVITFRESWQDDRLKYHIEENENDKGLDLPKNAKIWIPDTFFQTDRNTERHTFEKVNRLLRVYANGTVWKSEKLTTIVACQFTDLGSFPFDEETCNLEFGSYGHPIEDISYKWKSNNPVQLWRNNGRIGMENFKIQVRTSESSQHSPFGTFNSLNLILSLDRDEMGYFALFYVPTMLTVSLTWLSTWFNRKTYGILGIFINVAVFIALLGEIGFAYWYSPQFRVGYLTGLDVWSFFCLLYAVITIFEASIALILSESHGRAARAMDWICRIIFPIVTILAMAIYFLFYCW